MIKIYSEVNKYYFYQWELNQRLLITDDEINEVEFSQQTSDNALVCEVYTEDGNRLVNVPNILLQNAWKLKVYAICGDNCKTSMEFVILPRCKPSDYVYTETEIKRYEDLENRIEDLENIDLSNYATKTYINSIVEPLETRVEVLENKPTPEAEVKSYSFTIYATQTAKDIYNDIRIDKSADELKEIIEGYNNGYPVYVRFEANSIYGDNKYIYGILDIHWLSYNDNTQMYTIALSGNMMGLYDDEFRRIKIQLALDNINRIYGSVLTYKPIYSGDKVSNPYSLRILNELGGTIAEYDGSEMTNILIPDKVKTLPWDSITAKPFYKIEGGDILPESTYTADGGDMYILTPFTLETGAEYIIKYNNVEYTSKSVAFESDGIVYVGVGNVGALLEDETLVNDCPFIIVNISVGVDGMYGLIYDFTGNTVCKMGISAADYIQTIESDYLPAATETTKGGVIVGEGLVINDGVISLAPELLAKLNS